MSHATPPQRHDDEIDLIELVANLWEEKVAIVLCTLVVTAIGLIYAYVTPPTYKARVELTTPSTASLEYLNQFSLFSISPEKSFADFIKTLSSSRHLSSIASNNESLTEEALDIKADENAIFKINKIRKLQYPKDKDTTPQNYALTIEGKDRTSLLKFINTDLTIASKSTIKEIHERYISRFNASISTQRDKHSTVQKKLDDQLSARKAFVLSSRKDRIIQLEEALNIAKALKLVSPTSLGKLSSESTGRNVSINAELNNNVDPLYLRGTRLLNAELSNLKSLKDNVFLDNEILTLEKDRMLLENNRDIERLEAELENFKANSSAISFYSTAIDLPSSPIKPKKVLSIAISLVLGGILGLFVAIGRIVYKKHKSRL